MPARRVSLMESVVRKISVDLSTNCWNFTGQKKKRGHGVVSRHYDNYTRHEFHPAHRIVYEAVRGEVPEGHVLHHLCFNPACVNPWHLEAMTISAHMRLHNGNPDPMKCKKGHDVALHGTTRKDRDGYEHFHCRECAREKNRRFKARAKERRLQIQHNSGDGSPAAA